MLTLFTLISVIFFPWPLAAFFALASALFVPLLPLAAGIFADTLYYVPWSGGTVPLFTLFGVTVTMIAIFVRSRLKAGIIMR